MFKKIAALVLMACFAPSVLADSIPKSIQDEIKSFQIAKAQLDNGVLRVVFKKQVVNQNIYQFFTKRTCSSLWTASGADGWDKAKIERVEVVNLIEAQGFAFSKAREGCAALGKAIGESESSKVFSQYTWVCVAGVCRARRPGEVTAGD